MAYTVTIDDIELTLESSPTLFSPDGPDRGTLAMLSTVHLNTDDKVLDLGCGVGIVGLWAAKQIGADQVVLSDVDPIAVNTARRNAENNGLSPVSVIPSDALDKIEDKDFSLILNNPPYHTDFSVAKRLIEGSFRHLTIGGELKMVTKRLDWYRNKIRSVFGNVRVDEIDGYYVFTATKQAASSPKKQKAKPKLSKKLARREALKNKKNKK